MGKYHDDWADRVRRCAACQREENESAMVLDEEDGALVCQRCTEEIETEDAQAHADERLERAA